MKSMGHLLAALVSTAAGCAASDAPSPSPGIVAASDAVGSRWPAAPADGATPERMGSPPTPAVASPVLAAPAVQRGTVSGQRLLARHLVAADGSSQPAGWYDTSMRGECAFERAADGWTRCLPAKTSRIEERGYHLDPGCSDPLVVASDGCAPSPFASRRQPADRCGGEPGVSIYEVGERTHPTTVYVQAGDACKAVPAPPGVDLYRTRAVPLSRFVSARVVTP